MKANNKVLFITQEITPYVPESAMADLGRNLPQAIQERGREIRTFMPKWGSVNERRNQLHEVIRLSGMNLIIDDTDHPLIIKVASIQAARMQVYFIDNDDYFQNREMTCNADGEEYDDNDERAIFYARGVLETVKKLRWCPELIHCHGWMSAFAPIYIKKAYSEEPSFRGTKVVFSLFGDGSDFRKECLGDLATKVMLKGIEREDITSLINTPANYEEICKLAVAYSDGLIVSSDSANQNVIAFARERGIPVLEYQGPENYADAYNQFFQEIIDAE
jgi:starch synthase